MLAISETGWGIIIGGLVVAFVAVILMYLARAIGESASGCPSCGAETRRWSRRCPECGAVLSAEQVDDDQ